MDKYLRIRAGWVQTPVRGYVHPVSGRTVTVVGTMHIGHPRYYHNLQCLVDRRAAQGAVVQYECIKEDGQAELSAATEQEAQVLDAMDGAAGMYDCLARMCGWTTQHAMQPRPGWENVDITELDLVRLTRITEAAERYRISPEELQIADRDGVGALLAALMMPLILRGYNRLFELALPEDIRKVLIDHRNLTALAGVFRALPDNDVVLIWGAGHLPGIDQGLQERELRLVSQKWRTVGRLPRVLPTIYRFMRTAAA